MRASWRGNTVVLHGRFSLTGGMHVLTFPSMVWLCRGWAEDAGLHTSRPPRTLRGCWPPGLRPSSGPRLTPSTPGLQTGQPGLLSLSVIFAFVNATAYIYFLCAVTHRVRQNALWSDTLGQLSGSRGACCVGRGGVGVPALPPRATGVRGLPSEWGAVLCLLILEKQGVCLFLILT